jgi:D-xylonolactonase
MPRLLDQPICVWDAAAMLGVGPCWSARLQALWWVDILAHRLHRFRSDTCMRDLQQLT